MDCINCYLNKKYLREWRGALRARRARVLIAPGVVVVGGPRGGLHEVGGLAEDVREPLVALALRPAEPSACAIFCSYCKENKTWLEIR